jgi:hypothetical protein
LIGGPAPATVGENMVNETSRSPHSGAALTSPDSSASIRAKLFLQGVQMRILLFVLAVIAFLYGAGAAIGAKSALQEIVAGASFVVFAVTLSGAGIIEAIDTLRREVAKSNRPGDPNL